MYHFFKKIILVTALFLGFFSATLFFSQTATAQPTPTTPLEGPVLPGQQAVEPVTTCVVTNATLEPHTIKDQFQPKFFLENNIPSVTITITTTGCAHKSVRVDLRQHYVVGDDSSETIKNTQGTKTFLPGNFIVPDSETFSIQLASGELSCNTAVPYLGIGDPKSNTFADCKYYVVAGPTIAPSDPGTGIYDSRDKELGNLDYNCDALCNYPWRYTSDTSKKDAAPAAELTDNGDVTQSEKCVGQQDCYQIYSGLADLLPAKLATIDTSSDGSIGGLINMIIAIATGIAGIILVVRIFYLGFKYMGARNEGNTTKLGDVKSEIFKALLGFILLLCVYVILRTINPDLLNLTPRFEAVTLLDVPDRTADPVFNDVVESTDASNVSVALGDFSDTTFLMYLYHQQGPGGAPSILWAAQKGYPSVPRDTPFIKNKGNNTGLLINQNMAKNVNKNDMQKVLGTTTITPANFLNYWRKKVEAAKLSTKPIPQDIQTALDHVSQETGIDKTVLTAMCRIESKCDTNGITVVNSLGFAGLFQLSNATYQKDSSGKPKPGVWEEFKKQGGILLDAYHNTYVGAKYGLDNLHTFEKQQSKI